MGATVIEKHFTLDRNLPGPDHKASLEPEELKAMVTAIRNIEAALGDGIKRLTPSEARNKPVARKSLVASKAIKTGDVFSVENITTKRPGTGVSPMLWDDVIGRVAHRDFEINEFIEMCFLK
jgi:N,N'-diacetyllegionaminate synthase